MPIPTYSRQWRRLAVAAVMTLTVGCAAGGSSAAAECEDMGRSSTPAPSHVDPPAGVRASVEELTYEEPVAEDSSVEPDPDELRASWQEERLEQAGGVVEHHAKTGRLIHRFDAVVVHWDEPRFEEANVFFLEADGRHVSAFDTNDEFGVWGVEPAPQEMTFVIESGDLRSSPDARWTLTSGWAHYGWYLPSPCGAEVIRSAPVVLELPALPLSRP